MTVKVMAGEAAVSAPEAVRPPEKSVSHQPDELFPVTAGEGEYVSRRASHRRHARGSFGDVLFVQLILSVLLAGGVWSGLTFGGDEVREICVSIMKLFG